MNERWALESGSPRIGAAAFDGADLPTDVLGLDGDDVIDGADGNDTLYGGNGTDSCVHAEPWTWTCEFPPRP